MKRDMLFLGSQSPSRHDLLRDAGVPFTVISHHSSEEETEFRGDVGVYVIEIAQHKMDSLILPSLADVQRTELIVLTADSMVQDLVTKELMGKPRDKKDAERMLGLKREHGVVVATGSCLRVYEAQADGSWKCAHERTWAVLAEAEFIVLPHEIDGYLTRFPQALHSAGAGILEGGGGRYLRALRGSVSGARGLPVFELLQELRALSFEL